MAPNSDSYREALENARKLLTAKPAGFAAKEKLRHKKRLAVDAKTGKTRWGPVVQKKLTNGIVKWGYASWAMGCNSAKAVEEEKEILRQAGVKTEYNEDFEPIMTGPEHRLRHMEATGFHDRNGGYRG